jgi:hypothetical protein
MTNLVVGLINTTGKVPRRGKVQTITGSITAQVSRVASGHQVFLLIDVVLIAEDAMNLLHLSLGAFESVGSEADLHAFFSKVRGLHDCLIKQVEWVTVDEVRQDMCVYYGTNDLARLIIHSQNQSNPIVELVAEKVDLLNIRPKWDLMASGAIKDKRIIIWFAGDNFVSPGVPAFGLICQSLYYRIRDNAALEPAS